jgi:hypothetical protein
MAARLRQGDHVGEVAVHERFAAGETDLAHRQGVAVDLVQIAFQIRERQIGQRVIGRRAFDIAIDAGEVAQRAGVEPERGQCLQRDAGTGLTLGGDARVAEFRRVERRGSGGKRRDGRNGGGSFGVLANTQRQVMWLQELCSGVTMSCVTANW